MNWYTFFFPKLKFEIKGSPINKTAIAKAESSHGPLTTWAADCLHGKNLIKQNRIF